MIKKAILSVAGLGTRFLPASKSIPKKMVTVVDRPAIEYVVKEAVTAGIEQIILVPIHLKHRLKIISTVILGLKQRLKIKRNSIYLKKLLRFPPPAC